MFVNVVFFGRSIFTLGALVWFKFIMDIPHVGIETLLFGGHVVMAQLTLEWLGVGFFGVEVA